MAILMIDFLNSIIIHKCNGHFCILLQIFIYSSGFKQLFKLFLLFFTYFVCFINKINN